MQCRPLSVASCVLRMPRIDAFNVHRGPTLTQLASWAPVHSLGMEWQKKNLPGSTSVVLPMGDDVPPVSRPGESLRDIIRRTRGCPAFVGDPDSLCSSGGKLAVR